MRLAVSVCIATYNGSEYIECQIESILRQLKPSDELIIVDDASTDDTVKILESKNVHCQYKIIKNEQNLGVVRSFEKAAREASKEVVLFADQDDLWLTGKVEEVSNAIMGVDCVQCDSELVNEKLSRTGTTHYQIRKPTNSVLKNIYKNSFQGCALAVKRDFLNLCIPFPRTGPLHDEWVGTCALLLGKVKHEEKVLQLYRIHDKNNSPASNFLKNERTDYKLTLIRVKKLFIGVRKRAILTIHLTRFWFKHRKRIKVGTI